MDAMALGKDSTWTGFWWIPARPDHKMPGVLRFDPEVGPVLELIEGLPNDNAEEDPQPGLGIDTSLGSWEVIHGESQGTPLTLLDAIATNEERRMAGGFKPANQTVPAQFAIEGIHLASRQEPLFSSLTLCVDGLTGWAAAAQSRNETREAHAHPPLAVAELDDVTCAVHWSQRQELSWTGAVRTSTLTEYAVLEQSSKEPASFDQLMKRANELRALMSFSTQSAAQFTYLGLRSWRIPDDPGLPAPAAAVYVSRLRNRKAMRGATVRPMLVSSATMPMADLIVAWFNLVELHGVPVWMALSLIESEGGYVEHGVATAVAAAEALQRQLSIETRLDAEAYSSLKEGVVAAVPKEHQEWIRSAFPRNEYGLKRRLEHLARSLDPAITSELFPSVGTWADKAARARHDISHGNKLTDQPLLMYAITQTTLALITLKILNILGLSKEQMLESLKTNDALIYARDLASLHLRVD